MHQIIEWEQNENVIELNELFPVLNQINQVETADFYLFKDYSHSWANVEKLYVE